MRHLVAYIFLIVWLTACKENGKKEPGIITSDGVKIAYEKCGQGDTAILLVHGWCINKEYWESQRKFFCPRYTVVTIDLPGFGKSGTNRTDWSFDAYTEDIKNVIRQLGLKKVILVGHSMSGDIVLNMDNKYPSLLAGIVGIDNLHEPGSVYTDQRNKENDAFFRMLSATFDSTVKLFMAPYFFQPSTDSSIVNRVMNDIYSANASIATSVLRAQTLISQKEKPLMQGLSHKLYLINSDVTPVRTDSLLKYCRKGFQAELVPASGHYPMLEKPELFNAALQKVIGEILAAQ